MRRQLDSRSSALMELIGHKLRRMPVLPLSLRYPAEVALVARCCDFVRKPATETIDDWASDLYMSVHASFPTRSRVQLHGVASAGLLDRRVAAAVRV
jgi:hypothetical protein